MEMEMEMEKKQKVKEEEEEEEERGEKKRNKEKGTRFSLTSMTSMEPDLKYWLDFLLSLLVAHRGVFSFSSSPPR